MKISAILSVGALVLATAAPALAFWPIPPVYTLNNTADVTVTGISKASTGYNWILGSGTNTIRTGAATAVVSSSVDHVNWTSSFTGNVNNNFVGSIFGESKAKTGYNSITGVEAPKPVFGCCWLRPPCDTCSVNSITTGAAWSGVDSIVSGVNVMGFGP